jgi:L-lactate dehydrogenase complex protein LldG
VNAARDEILARVRNALGIERGDPEVARAYRRDAEADSGVLLQRLAERLREYKATVYECSTGELPDRLRRALADSRRIVAAPGLPATWVPEGAAIDDGLLSPVELDAHDTVLTVCAAACADTGTIALDASPGQGRRVISLIPDRHVCVVLADRVVATVPQLLARLDPSRPLTLISGPSATSDIELKRVEGVHGPRTLVAILVQDDA